MGRLTHRATAVAAQSSSRKSGRDGRRLAAARAPCCSFRIPWISRAAIETVVRLVGHQKLRTVGSSQDHRAYLYRAVNHGCIFVGNMTPVQQTAELAPVPGSCDRSL